MAVLRERKGCARYPPSLNHTPGAPYHFKTGYTMAGKNLTTAMKADKQGLERELEGLNKKIAAGKATAAERDRQKEIARKLDTKAMKKLR